ncbi:MarR family transcriptional regulator [Sphingomonas sanguinis]|uniref:MarR family transcriptional regulator n=1 Tax=Sphingomonas sanguinis TaxID=33051 RepID=A0ABU5LTK8_9SPHN|nr:MarR family transcriptional regulator [Sphingomonas sanguinis]MDZ7283257.1 MarR family transcriptional regulator [Sphingomonas sanguinis]QXT35903.1 MarR family transcriptional regulator [Sphingomonas sanguinis]
MSEAGEAPDDVAELAEDLRQSVSAFVRAVRQRTGTPKSAQSETLDLLESLGSMNVAALADRRGVTHQTMRLVVAGLDADGLVRQLADPADRRSRLVSITSDGQLALSHARTTRAVHIADAIHSLLSPEERKQLKNAIPILNRLSDEAK